jgi:hypothetical protein
MTVKQTLSKRYDRQNAEAAEVILKDITKYGGEGSGAVQWASLVLRRLHSPSDAGPLFTGQLPMVEIHPNAEMEGRAPSAGREQ